MSTSQSTSSILIHALFSDGNRKDYSVNKTATVSDLINMITQDTEIHKPENRVVSIIHQGKTLQNSTVISTLQNSSEMMLNIFYRLPHVTEQEPIVELRGFDRLQSMNYTPEQIAQIRQNFHSMNHTLNSSPEEQIDLEEEWFPTIFNQENPLDILDMTPQRPPPPPRHHNHPPPIAAEDVFQNGQPSWLEFLIGLVLGLILGPFSLVFMFMSINDKMMLFGLLIGSISSLIYHYVL